MSDGAALHLGAGTVEILCNFIFHLAAGDELVTADHTPGINTNFRVHFLTGGDCLLLHFLICLEETHTQLGDFSQGVAKDGSVYIVIAGIGRHHDVSDVDFCFQGTSHTGVDDVGYLEVIAENLGADGSVDLAHATADDNHGSAFSVISTSVFSR